MAAPRLKVVEMTADEAISRAFGELGIPDRPTSPSLLAYLNQAKVQVVLNASESPSRAERQDDAIMMLRAAIELYEERASAFEEYSVADSTPDVRTFELDGPVTKHEYSEATADAQSLVSMLEAIVERALGVP